MRSKQSIVESIAALLIFLFLYTGVSKYFDHDNFRAVLHASPLLGQMSGAIALLLPGLELGIVLLLILPKTRLWGFWASGILLTMFTLYLVYMIKFSPKLPCSCGGVIGKLSWKGHIFFNSFFILLSVVGVKLQNKLKNNSNQHIDHSAVPLRVG